ncbi:FkbM family methyltransferase [Granulicella paludicola]|uniref:FkbM family methyltransferase n=1 Tax=Granulicella paludicola TaxID=474951 RepID=UPI0021E04946|nr:FkbM family methyltransferase [Granulicella paludicola]
MSLEHAKELERRLGWTDKLRPMVVGAFVADVLAPQRRTIVTAENGLQYFIDPLSQLGRCLLRDGHYELETEEILREHLREGDAFLDVGANEGYFSSVAASIVGPTGYVAAVEPQSRLAEVIQINLALNGCVVGVDGAEAKVFHGALGGAKGESTKLFLSPSLNTGYSSVLKRPRFSRRSETVTFVDPAELLHGRQEFALVKVDVEGFEDQVMQSLLPMIRMGQIRTLLLDYHASILEERGVDPAALQQTVTGAGLELVGEYEGFGDYRLYRRS